MEETYTGDKNADGLQRKPDDQAPLVPQRRVWPTVLTVGALIAVGAAGIGTILWFSAAFTDVAVAVNFVVINTLSLFVLLAIIAQACIYWAQRGIMRQQWEAMAQGLERTDQMIEKMQGQLDAINRQEGHLATQAEAAKTQAGIMEGQLASMRDTLKHSAEQILIGQAQMRIAGEAMKISRQGVENAERSSTNAQRAYVTVSKREMVEHGFYLTIENSGNTPALDVSVKVKTKVGFTPLTPEELSKEVDLKSFTQVGLLAPHSTYEMLVPFEGTLTEDDRVYFDDPELGFDWWCTGKIVYNDIFQTPNVEYHETSFCFYQDRPRMKVQAWVSGNDMKMHHYERGNYPEKIPDPN